jgi:hypothetical protein
VAQSERFYFWRGYWDAIRKLPDAETRDRFVTAICAYAFDGTEPDFTGEPMLDFAWSLVADQVRESVQIGVKQSEYGRRGGRPSKRGKNTAKTTAFNTAKTTALSTAKTTAFNTAKTTALSTAESGAESEGKGTVVNCSGSASPDASATAGVAAEGVSESDMWYYERGLEPPRPAPPIGDDG